MKTSKFDRVWLKGHVGDHRKICGDQVADGVGFVNRYRRPNLAPRVLLRVLVRG